MTRFICAEFLLSTLPISGNAGSFDSVDARFASANFAQDDRFE